MQFATVLNRPLTAEDGVTILGATLFYLREKDVCRTVAEMNANNSAQGQLEVLRDLLWRTSYAPKSVAR
jgi:hypothetical protein